MSFIEKAIDLAKTARRQEEDGPRKSLDQLLEQQETVAVMPTSSRREIKEIHYTITKTIPVSYDTLTRNRLLGGELDPVVVQGYKLLRTNVLQKTMPHNHNVLMVTSPLPNEGKTLTAINLAISIAQELTQTVLLVDLDLRFPCIPSYFGFQSKQGLTDYLHGQATIPELLVHPEGIDGLVILPAGQPTDKAAELLRSPRMHDLVVELKHFYQDRYIIFDLPPMLSYADALTFAPQVDGIIVVSAARQTSKENLRRCQEMLKNYPILGYVFNKADESLDSGNYRYAERYEVPPPQSWFKRLFARS